MLCFPSATNFYLSKSGNRIPIPSDAPRDRKILYKMLDPTAIVSTVYAIPSEFSRSIDPSIKNYIRQEYQSRFYFNNNFLKALSTTNPTRDLDSIYEDICKFPCNPAANIFEAASIAIDSSAEKIQKYLEERGIEHLNHFDLEIYPPYYLFFILSRLYSYPLSENQYEFAKRRKERPTLVDSIFDKEEISPTLLDWTADEQKAYFKTPFDDWDKWALDYLYKPETQKLNLKMDYKTNEIGDILYTWTDDQIVKLFKDLEATLPSRELLPNRRYWIDVIANVLFGLKLFGSFLATESGARLSGSLPPAIFVYDYYDLILY